MSCGPDCLSYHEKTSCTCGVAAQTDRLHRAEDRLATAHQIIVRLKALVIPQCACSYDGFVEFRCSRCETLSEAGTYLEGETK